MNFLVSIGDRSCGWTPEQVEGKLKALAAATASTHWLNRELEVVEKGCFSLLFGCCCCGNQDAVALLETRDLLSQLKSQILDRGKPNIKLLWTQAANNFKNEFSNLVPQDVVKGGHKPVKQNGFVGNGGRPYIVYAAAAPASPAVRSAAAATPPAAPRPDAESGSPSVVALSPLPAAIPTAAVFSFLPLPPAAHNQLPGQTG